MKDFWKYFENLFYLLIISWIWPYIFIPTARAFKYVLSTILQIPNFHHLPLTQT